MNVTALNPRKLPRQARSRALVDAILDAAARILEEQGREALNTNLVADNAGVSIGSLYQYFPNRDAIIAAVADRHGHRVHHCVADLNLNAETSLENAVGRMTHSLFSAHALNPALHAALDGDLGQVHGLKLFADHHHHAGTKDAMIMQLLNLPDIVRNEIQRSDMQLAAATVAEIVHALAHAAIVHPHSYRNPEGLEREAVRAALAYLRATD
jgi:AcrR family transcriptional regulator